MLCFTTQWTSVRIGEPRNGLVSTDVNFACRIHAAVQSDIGKQQWVTWFHCVCTKMATISILANTVRPSVIHRSDDTAFGVGMTSKMFWPNFVKKSFPLCRLCQCTLLCDFPPCYCALKKALPKTFIKYREHGFCSFLPMKTWKNILKTKMLFRFHIDVKRW